MATHSLKTYRSIQVANVTALEKEIPKTVMRRGAASGQRTIGRDARNVQNPLDEFWRRTFFFPTRYGDGSYPVLYAADSRQTALREVASYVYRSNQKHSKKPLPREKELGIFVVSVSGSALDLKGQHHEEPRLVHPTDYTYCQEIGAHARMRHQFIEAPSARDVTGVCLPIFNAEAAEGNNSYEYFQLKLDNETKNYSAEILGEQMTLDVHDVFYAVTNRI